MTWSPPEPTSVPAPTAKTPEDIHTFADVAAYKPVHLHLDWSIDWDARLISGKVFHQIQVLKDGVDTVTLDASYLTITHTEVDGKAADAKLGERRGTLGSPLVIPVGSRKQGDTIKIDVTYSTTEQCTALGWLDKEQTAGKTNPFLYSQCQAIHCRSLVPCIDSPSHKVTYTSSVKSRIPVLMSALKDNTKNEGAGVYHFRQPIGIPSYLIAIVGGDLEFRKLGERTGIWAEPPMAAAVQWEFEADAERFLQHAEKVISPYSWTRYDSVVLPPSFPYGGMENANLTTLTPTLVAGDRSLTDVLLHELCHSWSGNLTSCSNWTHFWLNEGWCVYLERLLLQSVHGEKEGPAHRGFSYIIGAKALKDALVQFKDTPRFQRLIPQFKDGEDPDDAFSSLPYEKGSNFLLYLERTVGGLDNFLPYAKSYFHAFYDRSVSTEEWQQHLFDFFKGSEEITAKLRAVDWDAWFYGEGLGLPVQMEYDTTLAEQAFQLAARWEQVVSGKSTVAQGGFSLKDIKGWNANQIVVFLERLHSGPKIPLAIARQLDEVYGFSRATNSEVLLRFFEVALEQEGGAYALKAAEWVKGVGRMKFCRTIFRSLNKVEPELAKKTFLENKSFYHPIAAAQIEKDLDLPPARPKPSMQADTAEQIEPPDSPNEGRTDRIAPPPSAPLQGDIVTIFGSTGTGKTQLAVEIAEAIAAASPADAAFGPYRSAEVVSCDSMQIYRGLDVITNKATAEETRGVPHHLIGFLEPGEEYDVAQFVEEVKRLHGEMAARRERTLTVVAGGTTYYLQHLLFPGRLVTTSNGLAAEQDGEDAPVPNVAAEEAGVDPVLAGQVAALSPEERAMLDLVSHKASSKHLLALQTDKPWPLWQLLQKLDPAMAARWHWKDARKVGNSLRIIKETRRRHSDWIRLQDQHRQRRAAAAPVDGASAPPPPSEQQRGASPVDGLRRLLFWVWCEPEVLKQRLDARVDEMVERGLLAEIGEMRRIAKRIFDDLAASARSGASPAPTQNYQTGIFQTIGYKQFDAYLTRMEELDRRFGRFEAGVGVEPHRGDPTASAMFTEAKEKMQQATRRYAKDQIKWVQNKLIPEVRLAQAWMREAKARRSAALRTSEGSEATTGTDDEGEAVQLYLLDATDKAQWNAKVRDPALSIVRAFLQRQELPDPASISSPAVASHLFRGRTDNAALSRLPGSQQSKASDAPGTDEGTTTLTANRMYICATCTVDETQPHFVRELDRQTHERGRTHRGNLRAAVSDREKRIQIERKRAAGEEKRRAREAIRAELERTRADQTSQVQQRREPENKDRDRKRDGVDQA